MMERFTAKQISVWTWRYDPGAPMPRWVFKCWHNLGDGGLKCSNGQKAAPGDFIVWVRPADVNDGISPKPSEMMVMPADAYSRFVQNLVPVPDPPPEDFEL